MFEKYQQLQINVLSESEIHITLFRIWTRMTVSISSDTNHKTTYTSVCLSVCVSLSLSLSLSLSIYLYIYIYIYSSLLISIYPSQIVHIYISIYHNFHINLSIRGKYVDIGYFIWLFPLLTSIFARFSSFLLKNTYTHIFLYLSIYQS